MDCYDDVTFEFWLLHEFRKVVRNTSGISSNRALTGQFLAFSCAFISHCGGSRIAIGSRSVSGLAVRQLASLPASLAKMEVSEALQRARTRPSSFFTSLFQLSELPRFLRAFAPKDFLRFPLSSSPSFICDFFLFILETMVGKFYVEIL